MIWNCVKCCRSCCYLIRRASFFLNVEAWNFLQNILETSQSVKIIHSRRIFPPTSLILTCFYVCIQWKNWSPALFWLCMEEMWVQQAFSFSGAKFWTYRDTISVIHRLWGMSLQKWLKCPETPMGWSSHDWSLSRYISFSLGLYLTEGCQDPGASVSLYLQMKSVSKLMYY